MTHFRWSDPNVRLFVFRERLLQLSHYESKRHSTEVECGAPERRWRVQLRRTYTHWWESAVRSSVYIKSAFRLFASPVTLSIMTNSEIPAFGASGASLWTNRELLKYSKRIRKIVRPELARKYIIVSAFQWVTSIVLKLNLNLECKLMHFEVKPNLLWEL